jgi:tetratricopeptide (TPR) repeat protein
MSAAPSNRQAAWAAAQRLREDGRIEAAIQTVIALWKGAPADRDATLAILTFLTGCGAYDRALPIVRASRQNWPRDARLAAQAGELTLALGAFDEAAAALRDAIDLDPLQSSAWLRLAHCRRFTDEGDADVQRFRRGWDATGFDTVTRTCIGFALGKALDDLGDYAHAAQVLGAANALAQQATNWRAQDWRRFVAGQLHAAALPALDADDDFVPVFIVGMPRSGTTLVASALARHVEVRDRGELNWVPALHTLLQDQGQLRSHAALGSIAALIRAQMRRDDAPAQFYLDKNPLNFRYLDFIAGCFPNAKIVHCRRGLRDTALSIWMQHFAHEDLGFSYAFREIAEVEQGCRVLLEQGRAREGLAMIEIDYEDFVAEPVQQRRRLADFLGLRMIADDESSAEKPQIVTTASVWQVRQPVYTHAVERWRRYAPYLPELTALFPDRVGT